MNPRIRIAEASPDNLETIDRIRHTVYAAELGQFKPCREATIHDRPNIASHYVAAFEEDTLVGFVAITPPSSPSYSIDKYLDRKASGLTFDDTLFEIRALTVIAESRGTQIAPALMYAAFRWIQARGGKELVAVGHRKVRSMYIRMGMRPLGPNFVCGALEYELLSAPLEGIQSELTRFDARLKRLEKQIDWALDIPFRPVVECYHGGAFFDAIGNTFDALSRRNEIINADVLDAWFPPCPGALQALHEHLGWIMRTSPPNHAEGLVKTIARARNVNSENILAGGGSSPLIFLAFRHWLTDQSRVLILDPTYGEYAHVLERVVGCTVDRFRLWREDGYIVDTERLGEKIRQGYDLVVWVNPNSPTGRHVPRSEMEQVLSQCPSTTRVWIDETYVEYAGSEQSLEVYAAQSSNVVVVKSMSKVYGLSGLRIGYLCSSRDILAPLRGLIPPWSVSLPAQVAAIHALNDPNYYEKRYQVTHRYRGELIRALRNAGITEIVPGIANFILFHLPEDGPDGNTLIKACRDRGLFIRDAAEMGADMGDRAIRMAVKDSETNHRMIQILADALAHNVQPVACHA